MYTPSKEILEKYADLMVNFAVGDGKGVQKGEIVYVQIPECAKPFYIPLQQAILRAGGYPMMEYLADGVSKSFFSEIPDELLTFYPKNYLLSRVEAIDHRIYVLAEADKHELQGVDPQKIFRRAQAAKFYRDALNKKESEGQYTWTLCMYGTQAMADEVGCSLEDYWKQIIDACHLNAADPKVEWKEIWSGIHKALAYLNEKEIEKLHVIGGDVDLHLTVGEKRKWLGGTGHNMPSYEIYMCPDRRGTEGWIRFDQPLYRHGVLIEGIELHFKNGIVEKATATKNEEYLLEMIAQENADKLGEFSFTDKRLSRITRFMGETLYDENVGGEFGNTHVAVGASFEAGYDGDPAQMNEEDWKELGFNKSAIHTDIITTTDRKVIAYYKDGTEEVLYENGMYTFI